jgi:hypothetical protein
MAHHRRCRADLHAGRRALRSVLRECPEPLEGATRSSPSRPLLQEIRTMKINRIMGASALSATAAIAAVAMAVPAGAAGGPAVKFTGQPKTVAGAETFMITTSGFKVDAKDVGKANKAGKGHIHFQMDGGKFDFPKYSGANGKLAVALKVAGTYSPAVADTITYKHLPKGMHTLKVFLVHNDHSNYKGATAKITFQVM